MTDRERKLIMYATSILNLLEREEFWNADDILDKVCDNAIDLGLADFVDSEFVIVKG